MFEFVIILIVLCFVWGLSYLSRPPSTAKRNESDLVSFGNFMVSKERKEKNTKNYVGHWDLHNWKKLNA